jgi:hypothetical protein
MLTGSGFGVREHTTSVSTGGIADVASAISDDVGFIKKLFRGMIFMVSLQRTREEMNTSEPEDCMYGIRKPSEVYKLINELKEGMRSQSTGQGTGQRAAVSVQPIQEEVVAVEPDDALDNLDADMDIN